MPRRPDDDDVKAVWIPLSADARVRLAAYARACGRPPLELAAELLDHLLADDEAEHTPPRSFLM